MAKKKQKPPPEYEMFMAVTSQHWGIGDTAEEAKQQMRKVGGRLKNGYVVYRFHGSLPFAPRDREAKDNEADCWLGSDGLMTWVRCNRTEVERKKYLKPGQKRVK